jgi:hypothetical protein
VTRWQSRMVIVALGGYASWALFHHVTQNWQSDCVSRRYLPAQDMVTCTWFTTWSGAVQLIVSALPGVFLALGAIAWSAWRHDPEPGSMTGRGAGRRSGLFLIAGAAALLIVGFLPWYAVRWKGVSDVSFTSPNNPPPVSIHHSYASAWEASSHWSIGLLLIAAAAALGAMALWSGPAMPRVARALVVLCLVVGVAELATQWWLLVRPVRPGIPGLRIFTGQVPARYLPGYIGRNALVWTNFPGIRQGPTGIAFASSAVALLVSGWLALRLLVGRRVKTFVS